VSTCAPCVRVVSLKSILGEVVLFPVGSTGSIFSKTQRRFLSIGNHDQHYPAIRFDHFYGIELEREIMVDSAELLKTVVAEIDRGSLIQNRGNGWVWWSRRNDGRILEQAGRIIGLRRERRKPAALPTRTAFRPQSQSGSSRPSSASPRLLAEMGGEQPPPRTARHCLATEMR
jgi:hypothetical protein